MCIGYVPDTCGSKQDGYSNLHLPICLSRRAPQAAIPFHAMVNVDNLNNNQLLGAHVLSTHGFKVLRVLP